MLAMARKKNHESAADESPKRDRQTVQLPGNWHRALLRLSAHWRQQKVWAMCRLIGEACEKEGLEHPPFPWEQLEDEEQI